MGKYVSKFVIFLSGLFAIVVSLLFYLNNSKKSLLPLVEFINYTHLTSPAFYQNSPYLRHRDLNNASEIFASHPALRESGFGSFTLKAPIK